MAKVTRTKNGSYTVLWIVNVWDRFQGLIHFQCDDRKPNFSLSYGYQESKRQMTASLKAVETDLPGNSYPITVRAFLDGAQLWMHSSAKGYWQDVIWEYYLPRMHDPDSEESFDCYSILMLLIDFPPGADTRIFQQYSKLLENQTMADVKFVVQDQEMAAHAAILTNASPVMAAMLEPEKFPEGQTKTVHISDIEPLVFQQMLYHVYTGYAPKLEEEQEETTAERLLLVADKYQLDNLKADCEDSLISKLKLDNALRYLITSCVPLTPRLKESSIQCLLKHKEEIWNHADWAKLNSVNPDLFFSICRRMICKRDQV